MKKPRRWFRRKVRNGRVRIAGKTYVPDTRHVLYDGRLDGEKLVFARYVTGSKIESVISLWGTPAMADAANDAQIASADRANPACVDGRYPWQFWHLVEVTP